MATMRTKWSIFIIILSTLSGCASSSAGPTDPSGEGTTSGEMGECNVVGTWVGPVPGGMLAGRTLTMNFSENGTAQGTCDRITLNSTWQVEGNIVHVIDLNATPAFAACDASLVGRYTLEFGEDCQSVVAVGGEDSCEHRRLALLGFRATKQ